MARSKIICLAGRRMNLHPVQVTATKVTVLLKFLHLVLSLRTYFLFRSLAIAFLLVSFNFDSNNADIGRVFAQASSSSDSQRVDNIEIVKTSNNTNGTPAIDPNTVFDFSIWDVEGESPLTREGTLEFNALEQCVITPNGNGCRHEQKVQESDRHGLKRRVLCLHFTFQTEMMRGMAKRMVVPEMVFLMW